MGSTLVLSLLSIHLLYPRIPAVGREKRPTKNWWKQGWRNWCKTRNLLKSKAEVPNKISACIAGIKNKFGKAPQTLLTDTGTEFCKKELQQILKKNEGVKHVTSIPYAPQIKGQIKRFQRSPIGMMRSMLPHASLKESAWEEACNMAVYLHNRTPCSVTKAFCTCLRGTTPTQLNAERTVPVNTDSCSGANMAFWNRFLDFLVEIKSSSKAQILDWRESFAFLWWGKNSHVLCMIKVRQIAVLVKSCRTKFESGSTWKTSKVYFWV